MAGIADILASLAEALELENELGVRTVEFDRALLRPASESTPVAIAAAPQMSQQRNAAIPPVAAQPSRRPVAMPAAVPAAVPVPSVPGRQLRFVAAAATDWEGEAGVLFDKMLAAMKLTRADVMLEVSSPDFLQRLAAISPQPKCVVVFGSVAMRALFGNRGVRRGVWTAVGGVPAVVTVSPAHIARFAPGSPDGLRAERLEVWNCLKSVLARIQSAAM